MGKEPSVADTLGVLKKPLLVPWVPLSSSCEELGPWVAWPADQGRQQPGPSAGAALSVESSRPSHSNSDPNTI